jgi:hypothetical protein
MGMSREEVGQDYLAVHQKQLMSFVGIAERLVDSGYFQVTVEQSAESPDAHFVGDELTKDDIRILYDNVSDLWYTEAELDEIKDRRNNEILKEAPDEYYRSFGYCWNVCVCSSTKKRSGD